MNWPTVTAIIPTRNRFDLLVRAVESVLAQDYEGHLQCLVVFDQEDPVELPVQVPDNRELTVISNRRAPGLAGTRNTGGEAAAGEYVAFCDDDDEWLPAKLRLQIEALQRHPDASLATCGIYVSYRGKTTPRVPPEERITLDDLTLSRRMEVHSSTLVLLREKFVGEVGLIDEEIPGSYGEDYDFLLRAAKVSPLVAVCQPLATINWATSYFSDRWNMIIPALTYQLKKHPELGRTPQNLSRIYGRMAFAHAASGQRGEAREWGRRSIKLDWKQPRGYIAYLVSLGVLPPAAAVRAVNSLGRGM